MGASVKIIEDRYGLQRQQLAQARAKGKIFRNDICPCDSERKHKNCHGSVA